LEASGAGFYEPIAFGQKAQKEAQSRLVIEFESKFKCCPVQANFCNSLGYRTVSQIWI